MAAWSGWSRREAVRPPYPDLHRDGESGGGAISDDEVLAWTALKPGHKIVDREGKEIGAVHRILADDGADIFHGVSMRRGLLGRRSRSRPIASNASRPNTSRRRSGLMRSRHSLPLRAADRR